MVMAFRTLLYRYFLFGWLFRDVTSGSLLERAAAWRHNREQAHWLPKYMKRWAVCGVLFYAGGGFIELVLGEQLLSLLFYLPSVLAVPMNAVIVVVWAFLKVAPPTV
jgi:hypothetical protein